MVAVAARRECTGIVVGYLIAAYLVVIGTLVVYGISIQVQRRALIRDAEAQRQGPPASGGRGGTES
jgi:hypothetical protein